MEFDNIIAFSIHRINRKDWLYQEELARPPDIRSLVRSSGPAKHYFVETGHEIISTAILSQPLFQVGQLSVTNKGCVLSNKKSY